MIYLVGVNHSIQHTENPDAFNLVRIFKDYLRVKIIQLEIGVIAEEYNKQYLISTKHSTAKCLALELGLEHRYCDPGIGERAKLGIPSNQEIARLVKKRLGLNDKRSLSLIKLENNEKGNGNLASDISKMEDCIVKKYWPIRERYWYEMISDIVGRNVIFICGSTHVHSLYKLLVKKGKHTKVLETYWKRHLFESQDSL